MLNNQKLKGPWRITFDTNPDQCNLHCIMCEEHSRYNKSIVRTNRIMNFNLIEEVIEDLVHEGLREVIPSTMGEPLLYKHFPDIIELIKSKNLKMNLTTNGTFPKVGAEEWGQLILPIASDVKISINGVNKNTNESIMEGIKHKSQIKNIQTFINIRDDLIKKKINNPTITFQATFMEKNLNELPDLVRCAISLGIDRVKGHHLWITHDELDAQSLRKNKKSINEWNETVIKLQKIAGTVMLKNGKKIKLDNIYPISNETKDPLTSEDFICPFLGREAWIAWDGTFNVCCAPDELRRTLGAYGNVNEVNFMEIWNSKRYNELVNNWGSHNVCKECNMRRPLNHIGGYWFE